MELIASFVAGLSIGTLLGWLLFTRTADLYTAERKSAQVEPPANEAKTTRKLPEIMLLKTAVEFIIK